MRIAIVCDSLDISFGGPSVAIPRLAQELISQGVAVRLFSCSHISSDDTQMLVPEIEHQVYVIGTVGWTKFGFAPGLESALDTFFDDSSDERVVYINGLWRFFQVQAARYAQVKGCKIVVAPRGMLMDEAFAHRAYLKKLFWFLWLKSAYERADIIHTTSMPEARAITRLLGSVNTKVIPHGIDEFNDYSEADVIAAKSLLQVPVNTFCLLFLGRITEHKQVHLLIDALATVIFDYPDVKLLVAGEESEDKYINKLRSRCSELKVEDSVLFVGRVEGALKRNVLMAGDLLVLPSKSENFGVVVSEALSFGVPVIVTENSPWGILSDLGLGSTTSCTVSDLICKIECWLQDFSLRKSRLKPRMSDFVSYNSWEHAGIKFLEAIEELGKVSS